MFLLNWNTESTLIFYVFSISQRERLNSSIFRVRDPYQWKQPETWFPAWLLLLYQFDILSDVVGCVNPLSEQL